ncbi:Transcriptional regulator, LysR family [Labilithrix luteola]|uniref:Transcriptional regulator, LysR family n=1 Tax=Labilithrix luteola TaxID=1391654 RepID=A0A0K1PQ79_9BACT|nr:LysR substrate-binding domain-containing protein [Labilithrix luteola]AKU95541.1 Transcriptional regulator, LysR family [Labilithrix luteola]
MNDRLRSLNLNDLYLFVQVVDRKGFTAASRALRIPKSTLSKRVSALETHLGVRLMQRTSRRLVITEIGQEVYRHGAAMVVEAESVDAVVRGRLAEPSGTVRVTVSATTAQVAFKRLLPRFARAHPKVRMVLHATNRYVDLVQEGFDVAVRAHYAPLADSDLIQRRLGASIVFLVAAPAYLERRGTPRRPEEITEHDGLLNAPSDGAASWPLYDARGHAKVASPMPRLYADEPSTLVAAAVAGLGIACLPRALSRAAIKSGSLVRVLPEWRGAVATMSILTPHRRGQLPAVRAVVDFLATELPSAMALES